MQTSPSIRLIVLIAASLFSLLIGVFLGLRFAGDGPAVSAGASEAPVRVLAEESVAWDAGTRELLAMDAALPVAGLDVAVDALDAQVAGLESFMRLGLTDPLAAAQDALSASNDLERTSKLALLLSNASPEAMAGIADLISSESDGYERMQQMGMVFYAWGRVDAPAAVAYAEAQGGRHAAMGVGVALSSWASLDPSSARDWVDSSEHPGRYQRGLLIGWSENNPLQALQYMSGLGGDSKLMDRWTAPQIARNLIGARGVMALDDLASMPATRDRRELLERLADELGETDPAGAALRLSAIQDPEFLRTAVPEVAQEWAQDDPQAALDFVLKYRDDPQVYARAMGEVIEEWAERDPYEAGLYLNEQPASPELDRAVSEYSREAARVDPDAAMSFAVSVHNAGLRKETIRRVAQEWQRSSPEAYAVWAADNSEIAPSLKKKN